MTEGSEKGANAIKDPLAETDLQALAHRPTAPPAHKDLDEAGLDDATESEDLVDEPEDGPLAATDALQQSEFKLLRPDPGVLAELSPWRWAIAFAVIAMLLALFCFILFWGLTHSSWWY
jgi:hypothetical protein